MKDWLFFAESEDINMGVSRDISQLFTPFKDFLLYYFNKMEALNG